MIASPVTVTRPDGTVEVKPAYTLDELSLIVNRNHLDKQFQHSDGSMSTKDVAALLGVSGSCVQRNAVGLGGWRSKIGHWRFRKDVALRRAEELGLA